MSSRTALAGLFLALTTPLLAAQVEHGGRPPSQGRVLRKPVPTEHMRPVRNDLLLAEDEALAEAALADPDEPRNKPLRFAEVLDVDLDLLKSGVWEELGRGDRVWRLRIHSPGAKSLGLVFRRYQLPEGAELYVYDDGRKTVRGSYTDLENQLDGEFAVQPTRGDALTLEYFEPARSRGQGELALAFVAHDYRGVPDLLDPQDRSGSGGSGSCEIDVACPLGATRQNQVRGTVKVVSMVTGSYCSGSLLNNTANDGTMLVLTAAHCGGLTNGVFTFNYERPLCNSGTAPTTSTVTGATLLVKDLDIDVQLLRLNVPQTPFGFPAYLLGWDRSDVNPAQSVVIHHPGGAEKKISLDDDVPFKSVNFWRIRDWERGVTEGGSSGAPMIDPAGRFVGNLDSGSSSCAVPTNDDFCTRLAAAWPWLEPYLDPLGTGQLTMDGFDLSQTVAQPFAVTSVFPQQVPVLDPSVLRPLRIIGSGFRQTTEVLLDGVALPQVLWVRGGYSCLNINLPPTGAGVHTLSARENGQTLSATFNVVGVTDVRLQVQNGFVDEILYSTAGVDTYHADVPGHVHYCFWSLSNQPSIHPVLSLGIGNNFTDLRWCRIHAIPPEGVLKYHLAIPFQHLLFGTRVYNQAACISHGRIFGVSNIQQTLFYL